jgi:siroheme synthase
VSELIEGGLEPSTPAAVIERAHAEGQRIQRARLDELEHLDVLAPAVLVIGPVAELEFSDINSITNSVSMLAS